MSKVRIVGIDETESRLAADRKGKPEDDRHG